MAITTHDAAGGGLFDILGRAISVVDTLNTARGTTLPLPVAVFMEELAKKAGLDYEVAAAGVPTALTSWQTQGSAFASAVRTACANILADFVQDDTSTIPATTLASLEYLIDQMAAGSTAGGDYVTANTATVSVVAGAGNTGDAVLIASIKRGDGRVNENSLAESITATVATASNNPAIALAGLNAVADWLNQDWPGGSGLSKTVSATDPASSLLSNGDFEDETTTDLPDEWVLVVGTVGTDILLSHVEQQTVAISGTPTGGTYVLYWTNAAGTTRSTSPLAYNASASAVQTALRVIPGLSAVTVTATGTSPNYTHTIVFEGVEGGPAQLTSASYLTGGSPAIAHATTVAGDAKAYRGRSLVLHSDGATLTALYQPLSDLSADTPYAFHCRMRADSAIAAGELRVEIVDEIGGNVIADSQSVDNVLVIDATALTTSYASESFFFRLPPGTQMPVYLRIRISSAVTTGRDVYLDEAAVVKATELYAGGPYVAAFGGLDLTSVNDTWTLTVTNDYGGQFQTWFNRVFAMAPKRLLLPTAGTTLIPDSLLSYP